LSQTNLCDDGRRPRMAKCPCSPPHENTVFARIILLADTVFPRITLLAGRREGTAVQNL